MSKRLVYHQWSLLVLESPKASPPGLGLFSQATLAVEFFLCRFWEFHQSRRYLLAISYKD